MIDFNWIDYIARYGDKSMTKEKAIKHWEMFGKNEGKLYRPYNFNSKSYLNYNSDIRTIIKDYCIYLVRYK